MVQLSRHAREGSGGKLADVLAHQLRLGDQEDQEKVIAAHKARGLQPPEHLVNPPQVELRFLVYWEAFHDLQTSRVHPRGPIPIGAILDYSARYKLDPDTLKRVIWATDKILLENWKGIDEQERKRIEDEKNQKPTLAGGRS